MSQQLETSEASDLYEHALRKIYGIPSLSVIGGVWKIGKTDFALRIAEDCLTIKQPTNPSYSLVNKVASNIETSDERVKFISSLEELKFWLHKDSTIKLYILDEANKYLLKRTPMSKENVETIRLLAEVSKGHGRIILIGQELLGVDKEFLNPTWCRAIWYKERLKSVRLISHLLPEPRVFSEIPKTTIPFDPYKIAPFTLHSGNKLIKFKSKFMQAFYEYGQGKKVTALDYHPNQWHRDLRKFSRLFFEMYGDKLPSRFTSC